MTVTFLAVISYPPIPIFEVGPLRMSLHGLFAGIGFLAGAYYGTRLYRNRGFDAALFQSVLTWALVGSLLGARWLTLPAYWIENGFDAGELVNIGGNYSILGGFA
ncbi:MAG: prolipoprotein diacylglyceryl transferase, partial [Acidimicrobiia bacterium]|nr:prolipoprotein diacylglyceryl transferase [Acidimicrobiia bacterium]